MAQEKAFCIGIRETKDNLVKVLNDSGLPIDVMDMILADLSRSVHIQAEAEYQAELAKVEESKEEKKAKG